jgi:hypothetical protein
MWGYFYRRTGVWYSVDRPGVELATQLATHIAAVQPGVSGKFLPPVIEFFFFNPLLGCEVSCPEAEFLDEIQTKGLLVIYSQLP